MIWGDGRGSRCCVNGVVLAVREDFFVKIDKITLETTRLFYPSLCSGFHSQNFLCYHLPQNVVGHIKYK
jgi:hypothetical protein